MVMKKVLFLILEDSREALHALEKLNEEGFNATIATTESLKHAFEDPGEHHSFNLRHLNTEENLRESTFCMFVVDADKLEKAKEIVRRETDNFKTIKGFMYSHDIQDYEGSI